MQLPMEHSLIRTVLVLVIALSGANQEIAQQEANAPGQPATLPRTNRGGARLGLSLVLRLKLGLLLAQRARAKEAGRERKDDPLRLIEVALPRGGAPERKRQAEAVHLPLIRKIGHLLLLPRKRRLEEPRLQGTRISLPASDGLKAFAPAQIVNGGIRHLAKTSRKENARKARIANSFIILTKLRLLLRRQMPA